MSDENDKAKTPKFEIGEIAKYTRYIPHIEVRIFDLWFAPLHGKFFYHVIPLDNPHMISANAREEEDLQKIETNSFKFIQEII